MPVAPSSSLATQRPDLASFIEFDLEMEKAGYVATQVFPVVDVNSQAGNFGKIPLEELLKERDTRRAPGAGYSRSSMKFEPASYATSENGAEDVVDDREAMMYAEYFDAESVVTMRALATILRNQEKRVADAVFNTTTWTGSSLTTAVGTAWSSTSSTPITDVENAVQKVYDGSGLWPNALVINRKVFRKLRNVTQIIDRIASSGAGDATKASDITVQMLAQCFDLDYVIVAGGSKNTANEGQPASVGQVWSNSYAMVCRVSNSADMRDPCIGRIFHWGQDGSSIGGTVETYRDETVRGQVVRVRHDTAEVVLYPQAGHLLSNIHA